MRKWYIDYEFNQPAEASMGLVSCAATDGNETYSWWLKDEVEFDAHRRWLEERKGDCLVAYAVELAEGRCVVAMGVDPTAFKWQDLMIDWRWLRNCDDTYAYGKVIETFGQVKCIRTSMPPQTRVGKKATKLERKEAEEDNRAAARAAGFNSIKQADGALIDCEVFFEVMDEEEMREEFGIKNTVRNKIIEGKDLEGWKDRIQSYNLQDISRMQALDGAIKSAMEEVLRQPTVLCDSQVAAQVGHDRLLPLDGVNWDGGVDSLSCDMGDWAMRHAVYAMRGLPMSPRRLENIREAAPQIIDASKGAYNAKWGWDRYTLLSDDADLKGRLQAYPVTPQDLSDEELLAWWGGKRIKRRTYPYYERKWVESTDKFEEWAQKTAEDLGIEWKLTESGKLAGDREYLEGMAKDTDTCPIKGYIRQTKEIDAVNGLKQGGKLWKTIGSDYVHRYAVDVYKTQTARNGQGASRLVYSGPHWMRSLIQPDEGTALIDLDFGSQEVFIAAALSGDKNLMKTYEGGDPYWSFASLTGAIPEDLPVPTEAQRSQEPWKQYKKVRSVYKQVFLGVGFGMGALALAKHVSKQTGDELTKEDGKKFLTDYAEAYPDYTEYRAMLKEYYYEAGYGVMLMDGWRMGTTNPIPNSVLNMPVQGTASCILRKACRMLDEAGLVVRATMHDAITLSCKLGEELQVTEQAVKIMIEAATLVTGVPGMRVGAPEFVYPDTIWTHSEKGQEGWERYKQWII